MSPPQVITVARDQLVCDFLASAGWDGTPESGYLLSPGSEVHDNPDQIVFITLAGGPGYLTEEGGADAWAFQARLRGPADQPQAAASAAALLDWVILTAAYPAYADGVHILTCYRMGAPPAALPLDPGDRRFEFTCTYIIVTGA